MKALIPILLFAASPLFGVTLIVDLARQAMEAAPGQTVTYSGTMTNLEPGVVDLNGINITFTGQAVVDSVVFFSGPISVAGFGTSDLFPFFQITVDDPYTDPFGSLLGSFTIVGGIEGINGYDGNASDVLGSQNFQLDVVPTPEPSTWMLLIGGFMAMTMPTWKPQLVRAVSRRRS